MIEFAHKKILKERFLGARKHFLNKLPILPNQQFKTHSQNNLIFTNLKNKKKIEVEGLF